MIRPVYDKVLVEVESEWRNELITKSGVIGVAFENDVDRSSGAQRKGTVVALPRATSNHYITSRITERLMIGDTVYFHFNSIKEHSRVQLNPSDKPSYLVNLSSIFCIVRAGKILMHGGRVLCEPVFDSDVVDEGGIKVRKTKSGIISEINVGHNIKRARLAHIGNPLKGDIRVMASPGEEVYYDKDADFENEIEGKRYFCMMQEDLLMVE